MNNADVVVGWVGFSAALVIGYGAYKNKPVFGPNGIVSTTIKTGNVGSSGGAASATAPPSPIPPLVQLPSGGILLPGIQRAVTGGTSEPIPQQAAYHEPAPIPATPPPAPSPAPTAGRGIVSDIFNLFKGLFGGTPTPAPTGGTMYV